MNEINSWIWIRGLGRGAPHWGEFVSEFQKHFPQDEVEMIDAAGNGSRVDEKSCWSISESVQDIRTRSQLLKKNKKVHLLTISLGGMIAAEWAKAHPDELEKVFMINTSDAGSCLPWERMQPKAALSILKIMLNKDPVHRERLIFDLTINHHLRKDFWVEQFSKITPTSRQNILIQLLSAGSYKFPKQKPKAQIYLLASQADRLVSPKCSEKIAKMWNAPLLRSPTEGHDLPQENPQWLCKKLSEIVKL